MPKNLAIYISRESVEKELQSALYSFICILSLRIEGQKICSVFLIDWEGNRYASGDMYFYAYENLQVMFQYMSPEARKLSMLIAPARSSSSSSFGIVHHHQEIVEEAIFSQAEIPRLIWEFSSSLEF